MGTRGGVVVEPWVTLRRTVTTALHDIRSHDVALSHLVEGRVVELRHVRADALALPEELALQRGIAHFLRRSPSEIMMPPTGRAWENKTTRRTCTSPTDL